MNSIDSTIRQQAAISAVISGAINGTVTWLTSFGSSADLPLTLNEIRSAEPAVSVFGKGVMLALTLSLILSAIAFKTFGAKARQEGLASPERLSRPFLWWGLRVAARNALAAFGLAVVLAVLWQWAVGTVYVSNVAATLIVGAIAAAVAYNANASTMKALVLP